MTTFLDTWDGSYEALPSDAENINLGAGRIRDLKTNIRERVAVDHSFAGDANDGLHLHVEFLPQVSAPTPVNSADGVLYSQTISGNVELLWKDNNGHQVQLTSNGAPLIPTNLSVTTLTVTGASTLAGVTASGAMTVTGAVTGGTITTTGTVSAGTVIASGDTSGLTLTTNHTVFFALTANTYIAYNNSLGRFDFFVNNVLVGHVP